MSAGPEPSKRGTLQTVTLDKEKIDFLNESRIFFSHDGVRQRLTVGDTLSFLDNAEVEPYVSFLAGNVITGMGSFSYSWSPLNHGLRIGRYCSIAGGIKVAAPRHPIERASSSSFTYDARFGMFSSFVSDTGKAYQSLIPNPQKPMPTIGDDVWLGFGCSLVPGIHLGTGCVVAADAMVTKDVPPYAVVGGNPARVIKYRFTEDVIALLLKSRWWQYAFTDLDGFPVQNPADFARQVMARAEQGDIAPFSPRRVALSDIV